MKSFQSRSGFSVRRDGLSAPINETVDMFQSRSGFSVRRDGSEHPADVAAELFQSRSGFSVRRDVATRGADGYHLKSFNPGLGFRSVATPRSAHLMGRPRLVSIPVWVFGPSRRPTPSSRRRLQCVSIPVWVFGPSRQWASLGSTVLTAGFQSRSGFSVRRDLTGVSRFLRYSTVSIPVWVFGPSRLDAIPSSATL